MIPIVINHKLNLDDVIGTMDHNGFVKMISGRELTKDELFDMFGHVGISVYEGVNADGVFKIRAFQITHWTVPPQKGGSVAATLEDGFGPHAIPEDGSNDANVIEALKAEVTVWRRAYESLKAFVDNLGS